MKRSLFTLVLMLGLIFTGNAQAEKLEVGDKMPVITEKMKNVDGSQIKLTDVKGEKGTLVIFSCNHCPYSKAWEERIAKIGNEYGKKGFGVVQINSNDPSKYAEDGFEEMVKRSQKLGFDFPYVVDSSSNVARKFGAERTPEVFLFDSNNKLVYTGAVDDNAENAGKVKKQYLRSAMNALLSGNSVETTSTKAIGCSIKFHPKKMGKGC